MRIISGMVPFADIHTVGPASILTLTYLHGVIEMERDYLAGEGTAETICHGGETMKF